MEETTDRYITNTSPVASITWMSRSVLQADAKETISDEIKLGEAVEIVGMFPTILNLESGSVTPPIEAIDVSISLKRRVAITARAEKSTQNEDRTVVNLASISVLVPRLMSLELNDADPILSVKFRWATDLTVVEDFDWGNTQISLHFFIRTKIKMAQSAV